MLQSVAKSITTRPVLIQIAQNDVWEKTWDILPNTLSSAEEIDSYLSQNPSATISLEVIFTQPEGNYILGICHNTSLLTKTPKEFLQTIFETISAYTDFSTFIHQLDNQLIGQDYLLSHDPDLIRLGIVNHWFSVGPLLVWQKGDPIISNKIALQDLLNSRPDIISTQLNYQGLAFITNPQNEAPGLRHWIKSPCSKKEESNWIVQSDMIAQYLSAWIDFPLTT